MSVLDRDKFFEALQGRVGDSSTEEDVQFLEDMMDTYNDLEDKAKGDGEDWEKKYHELDETWRKRYKSRFFTGGSARQGMRDDPDEDEKDTRTTITFKDLFKED